MIKLLSALIVELHKEKCPMTLSKMMVELDGGILGCCIPVVGLILWLVWKDSKPNTAKAAGIGALVSVGLAALWYIFVFALGIGGAMMF